MQVVVTGATGFIGRPLCAELVGRGHSVTALSRDAERARATLGPQVRSLSWGMREERREKSEDRSQKSDVEWEQAVAEADAVLNLAGEPVAARRWTPAIKESVRSSRVEATRSLVEAIEKASRKPSVLVSTSAVGYYGDRGDAEITEESGPGQDFLSETSIQWEAAAERATEFGVRVCRMRLGIVLGRGSALQKMLYPLPIPISPWKLGLGGPLGNGRQWMPWVHLDDVIGLFLWAMTTPDVRGAVNATAPNPVTNAEFSRALGRALHRPAFLPVPSFVPKLLFGEFADSVLTGQRALPTVAQRLGYRFQFPDINSALRSLI
jgi:uncharacterized protein